MTHTTTVNHTTTVTHTRTITKTKVVHETEGLSTLAAVLAKEYASRPAGAVKPGRIVTGVSAFTVSDHNVVCQMNRGAPVCAVLFVDFTTPSSLTGCDSAYGVAASVSGTKNSQLQCGTAALAAISHPVIRAGSDVVWGNAYCQVRTFGVTCFIAYGHGFTLSRTGYFQF